MASRGAAALGFPFALFRPSWVPSSLMVAFSYYYFWFDIFFPSRKGEKAKKGKGPRTTDPGNTMLVNTEHRPDSSSSFPSPLGTWACSSGFLLGNVCRGLDVSERFASHVNPIGLFARSFVSTTRRATRRLPCAPRFGVLYDRLSIKYCRTL